MNKSAFIKSFVAASKRMQRELKTPYKTDAELKEMAETVWKYGLSAAIVGDIPGNI